MQKSRWTTEKSNLIIERDNWELEKANLIKETDFLKAEKARLEAEKKELSKLGFWHHQKKSFQSLTPEARKLKKEQEEQRLQELRDKGQTSSQKGKTPLR
ncbi:hypothetical protein TWF173_006709 [Orbilia oligospora]|nr:hypothetical protein TWF173_006709 [Orbilia oligospora]